MRTVADPKQSVPLVYFRFVASLPAAALEGFSAPFFPAGSAASGGVFGATRFTGGTSFPVCTFGIMGSILAPLGAGPVAIGLAAGGSAPTAAASSGAGLASGEVEVDGVSPAGAIPLPAPLPSAGGAASDRGGTTPSPSSTAGCSTRDVTSVKIPLNQATPAVTARPASSNPILIPWRITSNPGEPQTCARPPPELDDPGPIEQAHLNRPSGRTVGQDRGPCKTKKSQGSGAPALSIACLKSMTDSSGAVAQTAREPPVVSSTQFTNERDTCDPVRGAHAGAACRLGMMV